MSGGRGRAGWLAVGVAMTVLLGGSASRVADAAVSSGVRSVFVPITPCRLFDTRPTPDNVGAKSSPLGPGETFTLQARGPQGKCNLPADATGLSLNVAVIGGTASSFLTVFPAGTTLPLAANLNWVANQPPTPNKVDVGLSADGKVSFYNYQGSVNVAADVSGYYADHNFDDRYYTKTDSDGRYYTKGQVDAALATKVTKQTTGRLVVTSDEMQASDGVSLDSQVARTAYNLVGSGNGNPLCLAAPVHLPPGATVTKVSVRAYFTDYHNDISAGLVRRTFDEAQVVPREFLAAFTVPAPGPGSTPAYVLATSTSITDPVIDGSSAYELGVCVVDTTQTFSLAAIDYTVP